jgi:hypothetical protein
VRPGDRGTGFAELISRPVARHLRPGKDVPVEILLPIGLLAVLALVAIGFAVARRHPERPDTTPPDRRPA